MNLTPTTHTAFANQLLLTSRPLTRAMILAIVGSILLWVSAKISIPFWPVPVTMQTFIVLVLGLLYGSRLAGATVLLYLAQGAVGLPVFSGTPEKGIGIVYMMGPTGGYLLGFLLAAVVVGWLAERGWDRRFVTTALAMLIGNLIIYISGLLWLGSVIGFDKPILEFGLYPFLVGDLLKLALATIILPMLWRRI